LALPACCPIMPRGDSAFGTKKVIGVGGITALEQTFIAEAFSMLGMVAAAFAISLTL
jgi:ABC-2 type transport system permease protein